MPSETLDFDTWFEDDEYIGSEVSFPCGSIWKLETKIHEHAYQHTQYDWESIQLTSEARGVFTCSKVSGDGPSTAIIKIRLQIPWLRTARKRSETRAKQSTSNIPATFDLEVEALSKLTQAGCSSTPALYSSKKDQQTWDELVPGGYKLFILMEKLRGSPDAVDLFFTAKRRDSRLERDNLRKAFKKAWLETLRCGVVHSDDAIRNLIWDSENNKCYIVDWERWRAPREGKTVWKDRLYISFNLAQIGPSWNYDDMSDWIL
ncbi:hypothetical protein N7528_007276 [Penicillium herquei]|nr:hypothetical protein N7528_007276 [Penicillium herquei]